MTDRPELDRRSREQTSHRDIQFLAEQAGQGLPAAAERESAFMALLTALSTTHKASNMSPQRVEIPKAIGKALAIRSKSCLAALLRTKALCHPSITALTSTN